MKQKDRFEEMRQLQKRWQPFFLGFVGKQWLPSEVYTLARRIGSHSGVRASVLVWLVDILGHDRDNTVYKMAALVEAALFVMYIDNVFRDNKSLAQRNLGEKWYEWRNTFWQQVLEEADVTEVREIFEDIFHHVFVGQTIDSEYNLLSFYNGMLPGGPILVDQARVARATKLPQEIIENANRLVSSASDMAKIVEMRIHLINAYMFVRLVDLAARLCNVELNDFQVQTLRGYAYDYGMGMQIINDISDFTLDLLSSAGHSAATREKTGVDDCFADIRGERVSFPLYLAIKSGLEREVLLAAGRRRDKSVVRLRGEMYKAGVFTKSVEKVREYVISGKGWLESLPPSNAVDNLWDLITSLLTSKYVSVLETTLERNQN